MINPVKNERMTNNNFDISIHIPHVNTDILTSNISDIQYSLYYNQVIIKLLSEIEGSIEKIIEDLNYNHIEYLYFCPSQKSNYFISCLLGKLIDHKSEYALSDKQKVTSNTITISFFEVKTINKNYQFDSERHLDSLHKLLYEMFFFQKF